MKKGKDLIVMDGDKAIAAAKSCSVTLSAETIETSSPDDGDYTHRITGQKDWGVTTSHLVGDTTTLKSMLQRVGREYTLVFKVDGSDNDTFSGKAICTQCKITATKGNLMQGSFTWKACAELKIE